MMVNQVGAGRTEPQYRQQRALPKDVLLMIFERLSEVDLAKCRRVCRQWNVIGRGERVVRKFEYAFGARAWYRYFERVGEEPPLPGSIDVILNGPCPFWSGKKVHETHTLVLIPEKVNGKPFTLNNFGEMIEKPKQGHATKYRYYMAKEEHGDKTVPRGYWVLMTRDVLPGSRNKPYSEQQQLVGGSPGYEVPKLLEAATAVLMEHVRTGRKLYSNDPWTYTRCQEQIIGHQSVVGGLSPGGLDVVRTHFDYDRVGVGAARKFL